MSEISKESQDQKRAKAQRITDTKVRLAKQSDSDVLICRTFETRMVSKIARQMDRAVRMVRENAGIRISTVDSQKVLSSVLDAITLLDEVAKNVHNMAKTAVASLPEYDSAIAKDLGETRKAKEKEKAVVVGV